MQILRAESLRSYNTLALNSPATALTAVTNDAELEQARQWAIAEGLPLLPLGEGSNVVFAGAVEALVLRQASRGITVLEKTDDTVLLRVAAGEGWHQFVTWTLQQGYFGLENLALIPGTVGAAPIQNIGAYGIEFERFVRAVHVMRIDDGSRVQLNHSQCQFAYRESVFKNELRDQVVVTAVDIELALTAQVVTHYPALTAELERNGVALAQPKDVYQAVVAVRSRRLPDPTKEPNAGSFFKNPVVDTAQAAALATGFSQLPQYAQIDGSIKLPAAWLIEHCGFKGQRHKAFGIHPQHALVMVNYGDGDGVDLLQFAGIVCASVRDTFGIELHMEPRVYGQAA